MDIILTHDHTDFDAVASQLGAALLAPEFVPLLGNRVNRNVRAFLTLYWDALPFKRVDELPPALTFERLFLVETQTLPNLKGADLSKLKEVRVVDHHPAHEDLPPAWRFESKPTGACATIFVESLAEKRLPVSPVAATLLLLGIYEDTGSLSYAGTTPADMRAAAWLLEHGANLDVLRDFLHHPLTPQQRQLYRTLLDGLNFHTVRGYEIVIATASSPSYVDEVSTLAHLIRDIYDPAALFLVIDMAGHIQLVARSTTDAIPVGELMQHFGGGGHERAAAAFVDEATIDEISAQLLQHIQTRVRPAVTIATLMSKGTIRTLSPRDRVAQAAELMQRWGHEGFPVVDKQGKVVGVLTRRDVDRAQHHKLGRAPVSDFMHKGEIIVRADEGVEQVQQMMTRFQVGQVPVVADTGEIIGIVTRTDLLKLWAPADHDAAGPSTDPATITAKLETALAPEVLALVRTIAEEANSLGASLYFVGGFVRDLLLNQPVKDLDLVVEGDAIAVANRLATQHGGRIVAHRRFGTAKWILPQQPPLPHHIDLVTARTEFYEHPTALPQVEQSSIKQDLHRRDFTINTLAIALDEDRFGQLLDFYGGKHDLEQKCIRVLHNLSFVEDPTRILRAVRFAERLDFHLEPRTLELLRNSLELIERVSGDRLRHELEAIFREPDPTRALQRLDTLGVLTATDAALQLTAEDTNRVQRLFAAYPAAPPAWVLATLLYEADPSSRERVAERLMVPNEWRDLFRGIATAQTAHPTLTSPDLPPSQLDRLLAPIPEDALRLVALLDNHPELNARLTHYLAQIRPLTLAVTGHDLRQLGLPPGPHYSTILNQIRAEVLDGLLPDAPAQQARLIALAALAQEPPTLESNIPPTS